MHHYKAPVQEDNEMVEQGDDDESRGTMIEQGDADKAGRTLTKQGDADKAGGR